MMRCLGSGQLMQRRLACSSKTRTSGALHWGAPTALQHSTWQQCKLHAAPSLLHHGGSHGPRPSSSCCPHAQAVGRSAATQPDVQPLYAKDGRLAIDGELKVVGLGPRGISASGRLMGHNLIKGASFWAIDSDYKVLSSCEAQHTIQVAADDEASLAPADLRRLAGLPNGHMAAAGSGVVFLLAAAGAVPGGSTMLLQLATHLKRQGFFVVAALTRPFEFEGRRKLEEADALIEAMNDITQLVVVVQQGVLQRASAELTIKDATAIADNTLEYTVRAILWALGAPEVLRASAGTLMWHGRDLRHYKRLLSPPLERLLTCPGTAALGRGLASIPTSSLQEAGLPSTLSTLAEDAVTAASESPFLDSAMSSATAVLCVLSLPARVLAYDLDMRPQALNDPEKYAIRAAVQVAAMAVVELAGQRCDDVVVCAHVREDWPHTDGSVLCLEATLLVLEDPRAVEEAAPRPNSYPFMTPPAATTAIGRRGSTASQPTSTAPAAQQQQQRQQQQQEQAAANPPNRMWNAMSAIAGGTAAAVQRQQARPPSPQTQPPISRPTSPGTTSARPTSPTTQHRQHSATSGSGSSSSSPAGPSRPASAAPGRQPPAVPVGPQLRGGRGGPRPAGRSAQPVKLEPPQQIPRMADRLVDSLVAQSLDLPPSAAHWRHRQRSHQQQRQQQRLRRSHFDLSLVSVAPGQEGAAQEAVDLRSRVAGMLEQERSDMWEEDGEEEGGMR